MTRIDRSKYLSALAAVALFSGTPMSPARAAPLDKLIGKSLAVGNLIFSNFAAPNFVGAGPSNVDVQGVVVTDPITGKQLTGLRFVAPFSQSPNGGPHEIVLNVHYLVTDTLGQLQTIAQSINATAAGQAAVYYFTQASPSPGVFSGPMLTIMDTCIPSGPVFNGSCTSEPVSAPLFTGITTFYVENQVQLLISGRKGLTGSTTLQEFEVLFGE